MATVFNTTNASQTYRIRFQLYDALTHKRFTDTTLQSVEFERGVTNVTPPLGWTYDSPLFGCVEFYVQLEFQTDSARIPFDDTNGKIVSQLFQVCSPEH